jgi:glucose-1-phosphate cytidylyltransferase
MNVIILAGGLGTRISEETHSIPKPMINIGEMPILLHLMKHYGHFGFNDFTIALGYKGYVIKEFFSNYQLHTSDVEFDFRNKSSVYTNSWTQDWKVKLTDTGQDTMTGGRLKRLENNLDSTFMVTYGDGLSDVDISALLEFHKSHGKLATVTAVRPPGRYGALAISGDNVDRFDEKPLGDGQRINGGFFVFEPEIFEFLHNDSDPLETTALPKLAEINQLMAYKHDGFWQPMDTLREKNLLEALWNTGQAPWDFKVSEDRQSI